MQAQNQQSGRNFPESGYAFGAVAGGIAALGGDAVGRQPEVAHQLDMLERNVGGLAEVVNLLESRLVASILRPEGPSNTAGDKLRGAQSTPISSRLQESNDALIALRCRIESMHQRLEA